MVFKFSTNGIIIPYLVSDSFFIALFEFIITNFRNKINSFNKVFLRYYSQNAKMFCKSIVLQHLSGIF